MNFLLAFFIDRLGRRPIYMVSTVGTFLVFNAWTKKARRKFITKASLLMPALIPSWVEALVIPTLSMTSLIDWEDVPYTWSQRLVRSWSSTPGLSYRLGMILMPALIPSWVEALVIPTLSMTYLR
jgi:hypothetical protein